MRFMVIVKATEDSEKGALPSQAMLEAMGAYNEELVKAGVMLAGDGLRPSSEGAKVRFDGGRRTVIDGPFTEAKEVVGGYWFIVAASLEEAARIASGNPCIACGLSFEIRPIDPEKASAFVDSNETPRRS